MKITTHMKYLFSVLALVFTVVFPIQGNCTRFYVSNFSVTERYEGNSIYSVNGYVDVMATSEPTINPNDKVCVTAGTSCVFGPIVNYANGEPWIRKSAQSTIVVDTTVTVQEAIDRWISQYGRSATHLPTPTDNAYVRVGSSAVTVCMAAVVPGSNIKFYPGFAISNCMIAPPMPVFCDSLPDMSFDHGTISTGNNLQNKVNVDATLTCSGATSATFSLSAPLGLDSGIINHFYVNNELLDSAPVKVNVTGNSTSLTFSSVIDSASNGGAFTGSSVLIMSIL